MTLQMTLQILSISASSLASASVLTGLSFGFGGPANAADSASQKVCLTRAAGARAAAIATGTPRAVADRRWAAAVRACKSVALRPNGSLLALKPAPRSDDYIPKKGPKKGPKTAIRFTIAEGIDIPRLPRCSQPPCKPGTTTLFGEQSPATSRGGRTVDGPKGSEGGGSRRDSVIHYFA